MLNERQQLLLCCCYLSINKSKLFLTNPNVNLTKSIWLFNQLEPCKTDKQTERQKVSEAFIMFRLFSCFFTSSKYYKTVASRKWYKKQTQTLTFWQKGIKTKWLIANCVAQLNNSKVDLAFECHKLSQIHVTCISEDIFYRTSFFFAESLAVAVFNTCFNFIANLWLNLINSFLWTATATGRPRSQFELHCECQTACSTTNQTNKHTHKRKQFSQMCKCSTFYGVAAVAAVQLEAGIKNKPTTIERPLRLGVCDN